MHWLLINCLGSLGLECLRNQLSPHASSLLLQYSYQRPICLCLRSQDNLSLTFTSRTCILFLSSKNSVKYHHYSSKTVATKVIITYQKINKIRFRAVTSKSELCVRIPWSSLNRIQVSGTHPRSTSDSWVLGIQESVTGEKDPSLGTSDSPSDLHMGVVGLGLGIGKTLDQQVVT